MNICNKCEKPFEVSSNKYKCKSCISEYNKAWYKKNKDKRRKQISGYDAKSIKRNQEYVCKYLEKNPCVDCGEHNIIVLEFDHVGEKIDNVSYGVQSPWSLDKLKLEISKCEVVCANCHRIRTAQRAESYRFVYLANAEDL